LDPDETGACKQHLNSANAYIQNTRTVGELAMGFQVTLNDIFGYIQQQDVSEFWLRVIWYAHFFNVDTDHCDNWPFKAYHNPITEPPTEIPLLTKDLRNEMNNILESFITVYVGVHESNTRYCMSR
jgi:hypothetical protein